MLFWKRKKDLSSALAANGGFVYLGADLDAGVVVDRETAMEISTVFACINILVKTVGQIPLAVYQYNDAGRKKAIWTTEYARFKRGPNEWQTAQAFKEQVMIHLLTHGDYFAKIGYVNSTFDALYPIENPTTVTPSIVAGRKKFVVKTESGPDKTYLAKDMFHIHAPSPDGFAGRDFCDTHRQTLSLAKALYRYGCSFFANGGRMSGILILPMGSKADDVTKAKATFLENYGGGKAHSIAVYTGDTKFENISVDPEKAQALESRAAVNKDIASLFDVPLWRLYGEAGTEEQRRAFYTDSIMPWLVRICENIDKQILKGNFYAKPNTAALLRADIKTRFEAYRAGIEGRFLNPNEVRALEDMGPYDGGDEFINPNVMSKEDTKNLAAKTGEND